MENNGQSEVKAVSLQKVEANRRNALKSTGPRTPRGKANVRCNAVKHGFFSKQVVISSKAIGEDPKEFEALLQRLWDHYQPADIAEELQVETIAVCLWRERRALRSELGEVGYVREKRTESKRALRQLTDALHGPGKALQILRAAESEVMEDGALSRETASALSRVLRWEELNKATLERIRAREEKDPEKLAQWQEQILKKIRKMIEELKRFLDERQASEESVIVEHYSIPDKDALNRILKYQALNDRRLQRALAQLERLQRQRRGDYVPPPAKISVDGVQ